MIPSCSRAGGGGGGGGGGGNGDGGGNGEGVREFRVWGRRDEFDWIKRNQPVA